MNYTVFYNIINKLLIIFKIIYLVFNRLRINYFLVLKSDGNVKKISKNFHPYPFISGGTSTARSPKKKCVFINRLTQQKV